MAEDRAEPGGVPGRGRGKTVRQVAIAVFALLLVTLSIALYLDERSSGQASTQVGTPGGLGWVEFVVTAQKVDPGGQDVTLSVIPVPHGTLAQEPGSPVFERTVEVTTTSLSKPSFRVAAGAPTGQQKLSVGLYGDTVTDYPFDRYSMVVGLAATVDGRPLPVMMTFRDVDPFFVVKPRNDPRTVPDHVTLDADVARSRSTFILAWFMMAAMWALALAVLGGARVLLLKRPGIVWPALGWMAATLFALVSMRNAAPGNPPIGSIMDYLAFFWAEALIAVSLTITVATGIRTELKPTATTPTPETPAPGTPDS
ncbi:DUF4436 family protein [Streptomyces sp. NPDC004327]|uniref:DUF4436 family protein n=1 Tax=Streptomyces sp. NPDC004327 TaxID=3364699 RepID=UPI0036AEE66F